VSIDLIVRGICCLRPGVPGVSDNIRVISIVDRFLEHARIFSFENGGKREVYLSSADWMPRNFQRRVEVMFPIEDEGLRDRVFDEILGIALCDNVKARALNADGSYTRVRPDGAPNGANGTGGGAKPLRSQYRFMELAREKAQSGPALPGAGGAYHVRTTPPTRTPVTTPSTAPPATAAAPPPPGALPS
jgi:polyphosphate kinase